MSGIGKKWLVPDHLNLNHQRIWCATLSINTTPHAWRRGLKAMIPEVMDVVHGLSGCSAAL